MILLKPFEKKRTRSTRVTRPRTSKQIKKLTNHPKTKDDALKWRHKLGGELRNLYNNNKNMKSLLLYYELLRTFATSLRTFVVVL